LLVFHFHNTKPLVSDKVTLFSFTAKSYHINLMVPCSLSLNSNTQSAPPTAEIELL
jgi:hypothetical protein